MASPLKVNNTSCYRVLSEVFGHSLYQSLQQEMAIKVACKFDQDLLLSAPPNWGKSLVFQLPALFGYRRLTIIVEPHIALINDQLDHLSKRGLIDCVATDNSEMKVSEIQQVREELMKEDCKIRLLYLTPERLLSEEYRQILLSVTQNEIKISIAIDEADCIFVSNEKFRHHYNNLSSIRDILPKVPITAITSVGSTKLFSDIESKLRLRSPKRIVVTDRRKYIHQEVIECQDSEEKFENMVGFLLDKLCNENQVVAIVFCRSRKICDKVSKKLNDIDIPTGTYHSSLDPIKLANAKKSWLDGATRVMCSTISLGLGIHNPKVRAVVLYSTPFSLDNYYQFIGRSGRDGRSGLCRMYFDKKDIERTKRLVVKKSRVKECQSDGQIHRDLEKLYKVVDFMEMRDRCRYRSLAEKYAPSDEKFENCYGCDNCKAKFTIIPSKSRQPSRAKLVQNRYRPYKSYQQN